MMFQAQHNRRFILAVAICQLKVYFNIFDQAGMVHSVALDMITEHTKFLWILAGLAFSNKANIGYDPSITRNGDQATISCSGRKFIIVETVFVNSTICGRETICYHTQVDGEDYVIKDSWPSISQTTPESEFLKKVEKAGIVGVPRLTGSEDLVVDGVIDSTITRRDNLGGKPPKHIDVCVH